MALFQFNSQLTQAISQQNGAKIALLFTKTSLRKKKKEGGFKIQTPIANLEKDIEKLADIDNYCMNQVEQPYDEAMAHHFKAIMAINKSKFADAYTHQNNLVRYPLMFSAFFFNLNSLSLTSTDFSLPQALGSSPLFTKPTSTFVLSPLTYASIHPHLTN